MIQLTRNGICNTSDLASMRDDFARNHVVRLPALLSADIVDRILERLENGNWLENVHDGIARELVLRDPPILHMLKFLMNAPAFLAIIRQITGCDPISRFNGRIYRMFAGRDHYDSWHNDIDPDECRLVGMSINLGPRPYSGGVFHLRDSISTQLLCTLPNIVPGDAIVFRISSDLEHFVSPVQGTEPKTAFAGWFNSTGADFFAGVKRDENERMDSGQPRSCD